MSGDKNKYCILTNDVEEHSIWFNRLRIETAEKVLKEGMPVLLDIYDKFKIKTTFFFTGTIAEKFPEIVKMVIPYGHEIGSHGFSHKVDDGFDVLPYGKQVEHLKKSKDILENISAKNVISFRAPALRINKDTPKALAETGYLIDSSVASQRFDMFLSYGSKNKFKWLTAPRLPYLTDSNDLTKKGEGPIIEIPLSAFIFPFTSTTMRIFPFLTKIQRHFINFETIFNKKPVVFDIHPNEFIDESDEERKIHRRAKNPISYFFRDYLRGNLKVKNLGNKCVPIYDELISYFNDKSYTFLTVSDYCKKVKLL